MHRVFVTGTAGFIGYHLAELLLEQGLLVHGYDGLTDHYDVELKRRRSERLLQKPNFSATEAMLEDEAALQAAASNFRPDVIVHLAAQAGVRYSVEAPRSCVQSNIVGTFNILEAAKQHKVQHLLIASTSSVYGASEKMPFRETQQADGQLSIYSATKKAAESMAHSYAHLFGIPTTMLRFFTVYGPWSRPDLALFRFVDAILDGEPIDLYNQGEMQRDFTFVADLVRAIGLVIPLAPPAPAVRSEVSTRDSLSADAPYRIVNIGSAEPIRLEDLVRTIESVLGKSAVRNYRPMQPGDVGATWADTTLLREMTGFRPHTRLRDGITQFVAWFRDYYRK